MSRGGPKGGPAPTDKCPACGTYLVYMPAYDELGTLKEEIKCGNCGATFGGAAYWK